MSGTTSLPSSFAFAFALILIRSRPAGVTIEDYVLALRKSSSPALNSFVSEPFRVNHSKLWQRLFHLSQQSNLYLRGTIATPHSDSILNTKYPEPTTKPGGRKRKLQKDSRLDSETNSPLKRQRTSPSLETEMEGHDRSAEEQHGGRTLILQVIFHLNRLIREPSSNSAEFTGAISTACDAILHISNNAQNTRVAHKSGRSQVPMLNEACQAAVRVWSVILSNLDAEKENSCRSLELVPLAVPISSIVRAFLGLLRQQCFDEAERRQNESPNMAPSRIASLKRRSENISSEVGLRGYNSSVITSSLIHMMTTAAKLHTRHQEIFDATASVFIQRIGESMRLHLFEYSGSGCTLERATPVLGISKASGLDGSHAKSAAQIEAPHLIEVLRAFIQTLTPGKLACTNIEVVEDLQKTLLRGVFGCEDEPATFPPYAVEPVDLNIIDGADSELILYENDTDWFLTQVWELIGWDILIG